ncbi:glycosyltransferase family 2 protein [Robertmurraya korlensis]|uniref:glycosyltransferase family 2 protein n=1 Tax=Robertmurraya korlensis TaxID=519977 RepID=UPI00203AD146|nr:glycosyltransferase family 2 protein [Robertmurraya korlensis]MCM3602678.1 glycosyltransferase family 2 protein [Robertmurraya korlensis]
MVKIDILLPIYNSYEETKNCIESILQHTDSEMYNLFLLDDKSPDSNIQELTSFYANKYSHIKAVRNEVNLGFPGNVNNGFQVSENDVVVINSDTLVTENWLKSLYESATSDDSIVAVNPMSNYGIISGLPVTNNEINDLFSYEELVSAFEKNKQSGVVESPLLIGFCMYMKRSALNEVGLFDAATFKRGYGEESDWCMRARQRGLKLVVAKDTYVHHIGGVSFGEEKEKLRRQSKEILLQRYPEIDKELESYVLKNHFKDIRKGMLRELSYFSKPASFKNKLKMIKHYINNTL